VERGGTLDFELGILCGKVGNISGQILAGMGMWVSLELCQAIWDGTMCGLCWKSGYIVRTWA